MDAQFKNLRFTRWVYKIKYLSPVFIEYRLEHRIDAHSTLKTNRYDLAIRTEIEPFKNINSKTKGANLYFRNCIPHDPKDETGMFPTQYGGIYYGDILYFINSQRMQVLVLFQIIDKENRMVVDVFDDFFTNKPEERNKIIKYHPWYEKKKHPGRVL